MRERIKILLQPLTLSGILTWAAVLLSLRGETDGHAPLQLALMAVYLLAFLALDQPGMPKRAQDALIGVQTLVSLILIALAARTGAAPVLLVVVAAQVAMLWRPRNAALLMLAANLIFAGILYRSGHPAPGIIVSIYLGFQAFAALTGHYARNAERTRDQLAMVNADLLATRALLADSARDAERLRVARELHDVAGHKLTAMKLNLRALAADPDFAMREEIQVSERMASELLTDIRNVVQAMRDSRGLDLETALRALAAPLPHLQLTLRIDPGVTVRDPGLAETLLRVVQEALTNAARHAQADRLQVDLRQEDNVLILTIEDNGSIRGPLREGNGIAGMRERIGALAGQLDLQRGATGGLRLEARVPL